MSHPCLIRAYPAARLHSIRDVLVISLSELVRVSGLALPLASAVRRAAGRAIAPAPTCTALHLWRSQRADESTPPQGSEVGVWRGAPGNLGDGSGGSGGGVVVQRCEQSRLSVGCPLLDVFLGGGVLLQGITELAGQSGAGKTQLALQLAITVQLPPSHGGLDSGALSCRPSPAPPLPPFPPPLSFLSPSFLPPRRLCFPPPNWLCVPFTTGPACYASEIVFGARGMLPLLFTAAATAATAIDAASRYG